jgi:hypothetical protein
LILQCHIFMTQLTHWLGYAPHYLDEIVDHYKPLRLLL